MSEEYGTEVDFVLWGARRGGRGGAQRLPGLLRNCIFNILTHNKHFSCPDV